MRLFCRLRLLLLSSSVEGRNRGHANIVRDTRLQRWRNSACGAGDDDGMAAVRPAGSAGDAANLLPPEKEDAPGDWMTWHRASSTDDACNDGAHRLHRHNRAVAHTLDVKLGDNRVAQEPNNAHTVASVLDRVVMGESNRNGACHHHHRHGHANDGNTRCLRVARCRWHQWWQGEEEEEGRPHHPDAVEEKEWMQDLPIWIAPPD
mmetsp:Transcript_4774/g.13756  ORF Transcript_4774/g.13756 Transcript_4774/m.13756 type:complete len:205 (-) Transcript_4774:165-779(-)